MRTILVSSLLLTQIWVCGAVLPEVPEGFIYSTNAEDNFEKNLYGSVNVGAGTSINGGADYLDISANSANNKGVANDTAFSGASITLESIEGYDADSPSSFSTIAEQNIARSKEGIADAGVGVAFLDMTNIPFNSNNTAVKNSATAGGIAVSGILNIMGQLSETSDDVGFELNNTASDNFARSKNENAVSGVTISQSRPEFGYNTIQSSLTFDDTSTNNIARADFSANAGISRDLQTGQEDNVQVVGYSSGNKARSESYIANSGIVTRLYDLNSGASIFQNSTTIGNQAKAYYGANAGVDTSIGSIEGSNETNVLNSYSSNNYAKTFQKEFGFAGDDAQSGVSDDIGSLTNSDLDVTSTAINNKAKSNFQASSGASLDLANAENSTLNALFTATDNVAVSKYSVANAGIYTDVGFIGGVLNSTINVDSTSASNKARSDVIAASGVGTYTGNVKASDVSINATSADNFANGRDGIAISGVSNRLGNSVLSNTSVSSSSTNNFATGIEYANSGVYVYDFGMYQSQAVLNSSSEGNKARSYGQAQSGDVTVIRQIVDSDVSIDSSAVSNKAVSEYGNAISGSLSAMYGTTNSSIIRNSVSANNIAKAKYGIALSGDQFSILYVYDSDINLTSEATANYATSTDQDAVSGVNNAIYILDNSTLNVAATATNNFAESEGQYTLANSGVYVKIGNMTNSDATIAATSTNNTAIAVDGVANAGNTVYLSGTSDADSTLNLDLASQDNSATSNNIATIDSNVTIAGNVSVFYNTP